MPKITRVPKKKKKTPTFVDLLHEDHEKVKGLFKEFEEAESKKTKQRLAHEIMTELKIHTQIEEEIVYPALREGGVEEEMMNEADEEHHVAKNIIKELENYGSEDGHYDAKVKVLGELVEHHIEEEEKDMFKQAKKVDDVEDVTSRMAARKKELQHQFGLKKAA
jgi:hypothetical protein